jgi:hypothetical protein
VLATAAALGNLQGLLMSVVSATGIAQAFAAVDRWSNVGSELIELKHD